MEKPVDESVLKDSKDEVVQPTPDAAVETKPETATPKEKEKLTWWQAAIVLAIPTFIGAIGGMFAGMAIRKAMDKKKGDVDVPEKG